ncbi:hypothetical protein GCM10027089_09820 [Nocardia thraciensis]
MRAFLAAVLGAAALLVSPAVATADQDPGAAFLEGFAKAFGSSGGGGQSRPGHESRIYPDGPSCYADAARIRRPGVTAECNPLGGNSGRYQLIVVG